MTVTPYPHQQLGIEWMLSLEIEKKIGGILADDPGLGKTLQILTLISKNLLDRPTLIIVPISILEQWRTTIKTTFPTLKLFIHYSLSSIQLHNVYNYNIVLSVYSKLYDRDTLNTILHKVHWGRIVLDECHIIKNSKTKVFKACCALNSIYKWGLSGTPLQNSSKDLINLLVFCGHKKHLVSENLHQFSNDYILRRNKDILASLFTQLIIEDIEVDYYSNNELEFYRDLKEKVRREYLNLIHSDSENMMSEILELLLRLRQCTVHPNLVIKSYAKKNNIKNPKLYPEISGKILKILEILSKKNREDRFLIITHFLEETQIIISYINKFKNLKTLNYQIYDSSLDISTRNNIIKNSNQLDILFLQIKAGGVGLNLQAFNKIIIVCPDWNPANEIQAIARAHRLGQNRDVYVYRLILGDNTLATIDIGIINLQQKKRELMAEYLNDKSYLVLPCKINLSISDILLLINSRKKST
jgi:SNF2 family DNA or RNA helicase